MGGHRLHAELADALLLVVDGLPARTKLIVNTREGRARARAREGGREGGKLKERGGEGEIAIGRVRGLGCNEEMGGPAREMRRTRHCC